MIETREHIKARMLKNAARIWGYPETESESSFDPLVSMLLAACSIELEKVSDEIQASRARVLERLVQLLSPDALTGAMPAHAIVTATPLDDTCTVTEEVQYYYSRRSNTDLENAPARELFFSPTASFQLNRAGIRYLGIGRNLYKISAGSRELVMQSNEEKALPENSLWLGIDHPELSLQNTQFYFDIRNEAQKQLFYHQLPKARWFWDERIMDTHAGYGASSVNSGRLDLHSILHREANITEKIKKEINAFYQQAFITLIDTDNLSGSASNDLIRGMIEDVFGEMFSKLVQKEAIRWICIDFPQTIPNHLLEDVACSINAFPVLNRRYHDLTYRLQEIVNIIPLQTEDLFIDLHEVSNDEGKLLNNRNLSNGEEQEALLLMRNGGVGRFDERDASSIVNYLVQLLRDESAAFSSLGNDFMNNEMKQLQQTINKLEQRLHAQQTSREQIPYLLVRNDPGRPIKNLFISYWSCAGTEGNNIKAGNSIRLYKGAGLVDNQATLVTTTRGGRNKLTNTESVMAYKTALLSKDRLVSQEDIKAFCYYQLGDRISNIEITKGYMLLPDQEQGYTKTLDIIITIERKEYEEMYENGEINFWIDHLKLLLEERSLSLLPYRIYLRQSA